MRRRTQRLWLLTGGLSVLSVAAALVLSAMSDSLVFFYSPTDIINKAPSVARMVRIGGLVETGSVARGDDGSVRFVVTDTKTNLNVSYRGLLPDLFREGQGVVAQGHLQKDGSFVASEVLARHDEKYMPPEVAKALKDQGVWHPESGDGPTSQATPPNVATPKITITGSAGGGR
jgi:cytochrome c-type biogenesis protein CcmE